MLVGLPMLKSLTSGFATPMKSSGSMPERRRTVSSVLLLIGSISSPKRRLLLRLFARTLELCSQTIGKWLLALMWLTRPSMEGFVDLMMKPASSTGATTSLHYVESCRTYCSTSSPLTLEGRTTSTLEIGFVSIT